MKTTASSLAVKWPGLWVSSFTSIQYPVYNSLELSIKLSCQHPWYILRQLYFTFTSYVYTSPTKGHIFLVLYEAFYILFTLTCTIV
jgi:hypothetical protein